MKQDHHSEEEALIAKYLSGEATAVEEQQLLTWTAQHKANEAYFQEVKQVYTLSKMHGVPHKHQHLDIDVDLEWQRFKARVATDAAQKQKESFSIKYPLSNQWLKIAAALLLVLVSGFVANYLLTRTGDTVYQTAENMRTITLPDGSVVALNRNSKLTYAEGFGKINRQVTLEGEGFFEVVPDATKPFEVRVDKTLVSVLGTSFGVQSYAYRPSLEVTVVTGKVQVATMGANQQVLLRAGERAVYVRNSHELKKEINEDPNFLSWKTKKLTFDAATLQEVVSAIGFTYGVEITISASVTDSCKVTVSFDNQSLDAVLNVLKSTLDLTYRKTANRIEIVEAGC